MSPSPAESNARGLQHGRAVLAVGTLLVTLGMVCVSPTDAVLTDGWITPILALEFAETPGDLDFVAPDTVRASLLQIQRLDLVYPWLYGLLLVATGVARSGPARFGALGISAVPFDLWENLLIERLCEAIAQGADPSPHLAWLPTATWCKWGLIAGALGLLAWGERRVVQGVAGSTLVVTLAAWITRSPWLCEGMALGVALGFLILILQAFGLLRRG